MSSEMHSRNLPGQATYVHRISVETSTTALARGPSSFHAGKIPFTQSQIALALSLQRMRPDGFNSGEYCSRLRKYAGYRHAAGAKDRRYIDTVEFWKDQYSKVHREKVALEVEISLLDQQIGKLDCPDQPAQTFKGNSIISGGRPAKRKAVSMVSHATCDLQEAVPSLENQKSESKNYLPLFKHTQVLCRLLQDDKVSSSILLTTIQSSVSYMLAVLEDVCQENRSESTDTTSATAQKVKQTFSSVAAVFRLCLQALAHLCRDITGRRCKVQAVCVLIQSFKVVLDHLHNACSLSADSSATSTVFNEVNLHNRSHKQQLKISTSLIAIELTKLVANILASEEFRKDNSPFVEVRESILSILLGRIGNLISEFVFHERVVDSWLPGRITVAGDQLKLGERLPGIELEGKNLAWALQQGFTRETENGESILLAMLSEGKSLDDGESGSKILLQSARRRLQETLLNGIFGNEGNNFIGVLKGLGCSAEGQNEGLVQVVEKPESFIELIWSVVGWQVLMGC